MKRILNLLTIMAMAIILTGCNKDNKELSLKEALSKKYDFYKQIKCSAMKDEIVDLNWGIFATKDKVYELSFDKIYSNEENCKEIPIENLDGEIIGSNGAISVLTKTTEYVFSRNMGKGAYPHKYYSFFSALGNEVLFHETSFKKNPYLLSVDNKIKLVRVNTAEDIGGVNLEIVKTIDLNYTFDDNEKVEKLSNRFIKTNKAYYMVKQVKSNKKECEKYADVPCKYAYTITKADVLTTNYNKILYAGDYIIDKDYNVYFYKKQ